MLNLKCEKCKYYVQHYAIYKDVGICNVKCGHCLDNGKTINRQKLIKNCEKFEEQTDSYNSAIFKIAQIMYKAHSSCGKLCEQIAEIRKEMAEQMFKNLK